MSTLREGVQNTMRTLKFRFWKDKKLQGILELKNNNILDMAWEWDTVDQFTGLLDKSGKEIYEGDIIRGETDRFASPRYIGNNRKSREFIGIVEYSLGSFRMVIKDQKVINFLAGKTQLFFKGDDNYEIIVNIYESKHLIDNTDTNTKTQSY